MIFLIPNPNHVIISEKDFISIANKIHNNQFIYDKVEYINKTTKITITCKEHGDFDQRAGGHLLGYGCVKCSGKEKLTNEKFIDRANNIHNNKYNYELIEYNNSDSILSIMV